MANNPCQYEFLKPRTCPYPPLDGDTLCLFHSQNDKKDIETFWNGIQEKLNKQDFDFEGYYFPPGLVVDFSNKELLDANFSNAIFKGNVTFAGAEFSGEITSSWGADFSGKITSFAWAKFSGESTSFLGAEFPGKITRFLEAEFSGKNTDFSGVEFSGKIASFAWAKFSGKSTSFLGAEFSGEVEFHSVGLGNCRFCNTDLRRVKFIRCDFASQEGYRPIQWIRQRLNLNPKASSGAGLLSKIDEKISIWTTRTDVLRDEIYVDEMKGKGPGDYALIARSYQQLKRYFQDEEKDYARAGEFFYGEMECKRKAGQHRPFLHLYWAFSGYGERYLRAFFWLSFYIVLLFPLLYYYTYSNAYETKIDYDEFRECLLYSLNVITLRGTEASQSFSFRLCSTLEMIFGLIQTALFFMALRSKLRR